jgi:hypothetical protein
MIRQEFLSGPNMATPKLHLLSGIGTSQLLQGSLYYFSHVSYINFAVIDMRCRGEAQAAGGGCKFRMTFEFGSNLIHPSRYNIMSDMAQKKYIDQSAPGAIWPNLLYLYHMQKEPKALHMVRGEFV